MSISKIFCFGDGYAASHIWPEWPSMIKALYPELQHENFGVVGAGNEFITSAVIQSHKLDPTAFFLIQWAQYNRFDKLLEDQTWDHIIDQDPIYHFNRATIGEQTWWISSGSQQPTVQEYHKIYIQPKQHLLRTQNFIYLLSNLLKNQSIFFSTYELNGIDKTGIWVDLDMSTYSYQPDFMTVRQHEVQPSPWVHICYVEKYILPLMPIQPEYGRLTELKNRIKSQHWVAYDPDRWQIWKNLSEF